MSSIFVDTQVDRIHRVVNHCTVRVVRTSGSTCTVELSGAPGSILIQCANILAMGENFVPTTETPKPKSTAPAPMVKDPPVRPLTPHKYDAPAPVRILPWVYKPSAKPKDEPPSMFLGGATTGPLAECVTAPFELIRESRDTKSADLRSEKSMEHMVRFSAKSPIGRVKKPAKPTELETTLIDNLLKRYRQLEEQMIEHPLYSLKREKFQRKMAEVADMLPKKIRKEKGIFGTVELNLARGNGNLVHDVHRESAYKGPHGMYKYEH